MSDELEDSNIVVLPKTDLWAMQNTLLWIDRICVQALQNKITADEAMAQIGVVIGNYTDPKEKS